MKASILLEDGTILEGISFGSKKTIVGEIVFNTGMTGYEEILTDPSYAGQVVVMTYPLIGNYGINLEDKESEKVQPKALIVKEYINHPSNYRSIKNLDEYLEENNILGVSNVDTRMLTKKIREKGVMKCLITTETISSFMKEQLDNYTFPKDIVSKVSIKDKKIIENKNSTINIGLVDFGVKKSIVDKLVENGCNVTIYPHNTKASEILEDNLDGLFLSNGPGDPKDLDNVIENIKNLIGKMPLYGICLGHQLLALVLGADTYKLKYGHRGSNHPVMNLLNNKVIISSQNHGYAVDEKSLTNEMEITYKNLNDDTIEGFMVKDKFIKSVQFHPEAGPGPVDGNVIIKEWIDEIKNLA
ncbi:glutamine-hydrolyzing carbamoyl-phosphate synthase small subunit [Anaeromicrobium sediminis]|uniref:Carbamoyl phosphate synthase small chain n=1 Tax=Anaeromicrobium sediminis TaxID=1478221 RepID=A0A267MM50_9FIRM|nr:glutamine-hydrolyzing carbamoyl-phosphate synthase small subunit [Anaeromicrobium sediminis]PAB60669.1 carbamoyl phosphate synthase small subunit [Anaeromicrobium sediminis]